MIRTFMFYIDNSSIYMLQIKPPSEFPVIYIEFKSIFDDGNRSAPVDAIFAQRHDFECIRQSYKLDIVLINRIFALYKLMEGWQEPCLDTVNPCQVNLQRRQITKQWCYPFNSERLDFGHPVSRSEFEDRLPLVQREIKKLPVRAP